MATYHISTVQQLKNIENDMSGDYILDNDLDLVGEDWAPIGSTETAEYLEFLGTFDGQGFTIRNLSQSFEKTDYNAVGGLFSFIGDDDISGREGTAIIKNIYLENVDIEGYYAIGGIVGFMISGQIENCHVKNIIVRTPYIGSGEEDWIFAVGGIGGDCYGLRTDDWTRAGGAPSWVKDCSVTNFEVKGSYGVNGFIGGLLGSFYTGDNNRGSIENCHVYGFTMTEYNEYPSGEEIWTYFEDVGGFIGTGEAAPFLKCHCEDVVITLPSVTVDVYAIGGFIGNNNAMDMKDCYCDSNITIYGSEEIHYIGGFMGVLWQRIFGHDNYWYPIPPSETGVNEPLIIQNCYASGNFNILGTSDLVEYIGGFIGFVEGETYLSIHVDSNFFGQHYTFSQPTKIINCYTATDFNVENYTFGGFIGMLEETSNDTYWQSVYSERYGMEWYPGKPCEIGDIFWAYNDYDQYGTYTTVSNPPFWGEAGGKTWFIVNTAGTGQLWYETGFGESGFASSNCTIIDPPEADPIELGVEITNCSWRTDISSSAIALWKYTEKFMAYRSDNRTYHVGEKITLILSYQCNEKHIGTYPSFEIAGGYWDVIETEDNSQSNIPTLAQLGFGTDEPDHTKFYNVIMKTPPNTVYDQGNINAWDFTTPIWYEHNNTYPNFIPGTWVELPINFYGTI